MAKTKDWSPDDPPGTLQEIPCGCTVYEDVCHRSLSEKEQAAEQFARQIVEIYLRYSARYPVTELNIHVERGQLKDLAEKYRDDEEVMKNAANILEQRGWCFRRESNLRCRFYHIAPLNGSVGQTKSCPDQ